MHSLVQDGMSIVALCFGHKQVRLKLKIHKSVKTTGRIWFRHPPVAAWAGRRKDVNAVVAGFGQLV